MFFAAITAIALGVVGRAVARRCLLGTEEPVTRSIASATFALAIGVATTRVLLTLGWFWLPLSWALFAAIGLGGRLWPGARPERTRGVSWREVWSGADRAVALPLLVALAAVGLATAAAGYLPIWAWDAAGYHLPFVNYVVQARSSAGVPADMPYLSSYPHNADYLFALLRLSLPDDTWVDVAQIPLGIIGAATTAALARRWGARPAPALAAGALWLAIPGVFLQLPSGYVDVCVATFLLLSVYFIVAPVSRATVVLSGIALGLFLGSKPNAPLATVLLFALLVARVRRTACARWLIAAAAATLAIGAPDYLVNVYRFGNPVWPVAIDVGPVHLPGEQSVTDLLAAGAAAPRVEGSVWWRTWRSWTTFRGSPAFDMRVGGLGSATILLALPGAMFALRRRPAGALVVLLAALLGPDPATARFILAFPAVCLALAAGAASRLPARLFTIVTTVAGVLAGLDLHHAAPGLTGEGPPLTRYPALSSEERLRAVGPDGRPDAWIDLRRSLDPTQALAFDSSFDISYLLWRRRLQNRVVFVSESSSHAEVAALLVREHVRFLIAAPRSAAGTFVAARLACFRRMFVCHAQPCAVYEVRMESCLREGT